MSQNEPLKRRVTDSNDHETRIAVLEKLSENCDLQRQDTNRRLETLETQFDVHLAQSASSNLEMTRSVTQLVVTVQGLADDLKTALHGSLLAVKHETIAKALVWGGSVIIGLVGGAWAVFTHFAS